MPALRLGAHRRRRPAAVLPELWIDAVGVKLSEAARLCVEEARLAGKWVHVGRVNSWRRLALVASWNVDSVDGSYLALGPKANGRRMTGWLRRLQTQPRLS